MDLTQLATGPQPPERIFVVVEIPRYSRNKYEYDPMLGVFKLDRVLYSAVHYPTAYGFIPSTAGNDGDCLDALVTTSEPTFPGCLIEARPVGMLRMEDEHGQDEKILSVPVADPHFDGVETLEQLPQHHLREIEHFFRTYKDLEGKHCRVFGWADRREAYRVIENCRGNPGDR